MSLVRLLTTGRFGAKPCDQAKLIAALPRRRGKEIERMCSDCECHRQFFATLHASRVDAFEVGGSGDIGAGFVAVAQTEPPTADVPPAGRRIDRIIDR